MTRRRTFIAIALSAPLALAARTRAANAAAQKPSDISLLQARKMRDYDNTLTDAQIQEIARQIDENARAHERLNPKAKALRNSDEPVTIFRVRQ